MFSTTRENVKDSRLNFWKQQKKRMACKVTRTHRRWAGLEKRDSTSDTKLTIEKKGTKKIIAVTLPLCDFRVDVAR